MSLININNNSFTVNLYVDGLPVVLSQQRLKQRLRDSRIIRRERLEVEAALASREGSDFLTLADHEDDKPLLLRFTPQGDKYVIQTILKGDYDQGYLAISQSARHVFVGDVAQGSQFTLVKHDVENARFSDLDKGPCHVALAAKGRNAIYLASENGRRYFKDVDPNMSQHDAFNNTPVTFILKVIDRPEEG
ncbi:hypothetical protein KKQ10_21410 [Pseudomonas sp. MG-9]|uniref:hypothetical protein n=1 Tax=Pseudomonas sp. MG-9 TaxID=2839032 RepID=UPI001BFFE8BA|nr:hypothetical protein [Pseudomonas sp. MG-9]MBT9267444.1 hypothetical protein [Pseudomonas sp. MG-9]